MKKYEVRITTTKSVIVEADNEDDAKEKANELPLKIDDFDWEFIVDD